MIQIKVFSPEPPCARCIKTKELAATVAARYPGVAEVVAIPALSPEAQEHGVLLTPTVIVGDQVVVSGSVPNERQLEDALKKEIGG
ncbi:MAG: thioredoxin family protein [Chloroflexi bacterium]|nr:thioredoxin family protein [Chloroflexota bacterium]